MTHGRAIIRTNKTGEKRWFSGGGLHTWKATAEETGGAFLCFEDRMAAGKMTPLHTHPEADEAFYVLEGAIVVHVDGDEHPVGPGGFVSVLRGVPHAFMTTSEARLLCWQTPGNGQAFFLDASESTPDDEVDGVVDFGRVHASAARCGGVDIIGPPPFTAVGDSLPAEAG